MIKEKNSYVIELLTQSTQNKNLIWNEVNVSDGSRRSYIRNMSATGEDGTKYEIEIKYSLVGDSFVLDSNPCLFLRNTNLPNGLYMISTFNSESHSLTSLRDLIKEVYCPDLNPTVQIIEDELDKICKGISTQQYRENKLNKLI
jgi:hypothetical protein